MTPNTADSNVVSLGGKDWYPRSQRSSCHAVRPANSAAVVTAKRCTAMVIGVVVILALSATTAYAQVATDVVRAPGWYTRGIALPQGAATDLASGTLATQVDVFQRWPDRSIKFAVLTSNLTATGAHPITATIPRSSLPFMPARIPTATVAANISSGQVTGVYTATLPSTVSADLWLNGSEVKDWRHGVPFMNGTTVHPTLRCLFDVRVYRDGSARISTFVLNVKDVAGGTSVTAVYTVTIDGDVREGPAAGENWGTVKLGQFTFWRQTWAVALKEADVAPDFTPFYASGFLHKLRPIAPDVPLGIGGAQYFPGQTGDLSIDGSPGARPGLGHLPAWVVEYLVHKKAATRAHMIRQSERVGTYHGHFSKGDGIEPINFDDAPDFFDNRHHTNTGGLRGPFTWGDSGSHHLETAHMNHAHYVPYLVTGDRFHYDAQRQSAAFSIITMVPGKGWSQERSYNGVGGSNLFNTDWNSRGITRGFVEMVHGWLVTRDDEPGLQTRAYWKLRVETTLDAFDDVIAGELARPTNVLGVIWSGVSNTDPGGFPPNAIAQGGQWMISYVLPPLVKARHFGAATGKVTLNGILAWLLKPARSGADYPWDFGVPYNRGGGAYLNSTATDWVFMQSMKEVYARNFGDRANEAQIRPHVPPITAGGYGQEYRCVMAIARDLGQTDAAAMLARLDAFDYEGGTVAQKDQLHTYAGFNCDGVAATAVTAPKLPTPPTPIAIRRSR